MAEGNRRPEYQIRLPGYVMPASESQERWTPLILQTQDSPGYNLSGTPVLPLLQSAANLSKEAWRPDVCRPVMGGLG